MKKDFFVDLQITVGLKNTLTKEFFTSIVDATLDDKRAGSELTIRIVSLEESAYLNKKYRKKEGPTNVLSFVSEGAEKIVPDFLGDLVVCAPVVNKEACQQGKNIEAHWAHMIVHGVLHLLGLDHQDSCQAEAMENRERSILSKLGYPDPY
ncbi:MAG: rRNA maturation RNase YbeY [Gammaproteobacteria bacterium]|jgi:probable rRNA maturation factor